MAQLSIKLVIFNKRINGMTILCLNCWHSWEGSFKRGNSIDVPEFNITLFQFRFIKRLRNYKNHISTISRLCPSFSTCSFLPEKLSMLESFQYQSISILSTSIIHWNSWKDVSTILVYCSKHFITTFWNKNLDALKKIIL